MVDIQRDALIQQKRIGESKLDDVQKQDTAETVYFNELLPGVQKRLVEEEAERQIHNFRLGIRKLLSKVLYAELKNNDIIPIVLPQHGGKTNRTNSVVGFDAKSRRGLFSGMFSWKFKGSVFRVVLINSQQSTDLSGYTNILDGVRLKIVNYRREDGDVDDDVKIAFIVIYKIICDKMTEAANAYLGVRLDKTRLKSMLRLFRNGALRRYNTDGTPAWVI